MPRKTDYTAEDVERALLALAFANGNASAANRSLEQQGHPVPVSTIQLWGEREAERYAKIRDDLVPRIHANLAQDSEDLARKALHAAANTIDDYETAREEKNLKAANALSSMARNIATVSGISLDKVAPLRQRPSQIIEHRTPEQNMKRLAVLVPGLIVESTAEEITDAIPINGNGNGHHDLPPAA